MRTESSPYFNVAYTNWYHGGNAPTAPPPKKCEPKKPPSNPKAPSKSKPAAPQPVPEDPEDNSDGEPAAPKASAGPGSLAALLNGLKDD